MAAGEVTIERKTAVIDATLIRGAKIVATHEGSTIAEVLERLIRPGLAKELRRAVAQMSELGEAGA